MPRQGYILRIASVHQLSAGTENVERRPWDCHSLDHVSSAPAHFFYLNCTDDNLPLRFTAIVDRRSGGRGTPPSKIGLTKWSARPTSSTSLPMCAWKIYAECVCRFCASAGIASFWWWKNSVLCMTRRWWRHSPIHRYGHTRWTTKCRTPAPVTISIVRHVAIRACGKWWWINWSLATTTAAWWTVVRRIWMARISIACCSIISNVTTTQIGHHSVCSSIRRGSRSPNTWRRSRSSWMTWVKCKMFILLPRIRPFNGCDIRRPSISSANLSHGPANRNSWSPSRWHAICPIRANCCRVCCNRIAIYTRAPSAPHNIHGSETSLAWTKWG